MKTAILVAAVCLATIPSRGQEPLRDRIEDIYRRGGYERELPGWREPGEGRPGEPGAGRSRRGGRRIIGSDPGRSPRPEPRPVESPQPGALSSLITVLPWIAIAALLLLILIARVRLGRRPKPAKPVAAPARPAAAGEATAATVVPDADRLAREGRYAEAIHALLLAAIERARARTGRIWASSLTSRELSSDAPLEGEARSALSRLVRAVEITRFGARDAGLSDFEACAADLARIGA